MILFIDNYDSFIYNLVQYCGEYRQDLEVLRNGDKSVAEILAMNPEKIIISPGPCTPKEAGISVELIQKCPRHIPLLGVCLGHQCLGVAFGGEVVRASSPVHGKISEVFIQSDSAIFNGFDKSFTATRYHSLIVASQNLPASLRVTATLQDGTIMAMEHLERPLFGVQFHPESIRTQKGKEILLNFLRL
jgi:anthranilate synthase/aminodeoxychorismate synthase-like glutamine amidotransferase